MSAGSSWRTRVASLGIVTVAVVAVGDWVIGGEASLLAVYALPVSIVAWRTGRVPGLVVAGTAGIAWGLARASSLELEPLLAWNALNRLVIFAFIAVVSDLLARWSFLADTDHLTGLLNRRAFVERLEKVVVRARRVETPVAVAFLDLDRFKRVNDDHGHAAGDAVLIGVARALEDVIRGGDVAARIGGDEFAALLWRSDLHDAEQVGRRILEGVTRALHATKAGAGVGVSVGLAFFPAGPADAKAALARADESMYEAKRAGKGRLWIRVDEPPGAAGPDLSGR